MANSSSPVTLAQFAESQNSDYLRHVEKFATEQRNAHLINVAILILIGGVVSALILATIRAYRIPSFPPAGRIAIASLTALAGTGVIVGGVVNIQLARHYHKKKTTPLTEEDKVKLLAKEQRKSSQPTGHQA